MKKIIIPAISLAALLLTGACSIDERTSGNNGNEAMLTLNHADPQHGPRRSRADTRHR